MQESATEQQVWTILSLLEWSSQYLSEKGYESARLNCELLLCHVLKCQRIDLYLRFDRELTLDELAGFKVLFKRRLAHEPLQYIIGETEFMGLRLIVDPRVLIPRPETEVLVEAVVTFFAKRASENIRILDIGTGSGCIAVALARGLESCRIHAIDVSTEALEVARMNIDRHGLQDRVTLQTVDFLDNNQQIAATPYDLIVSNPPYISREEFSKVEPEIREFEPTIATTDDGDGLTYYRVIAERSKLLLKPDGLLFIEIAFNQGEIVPRLFLDAGYCDIETIRDYAGIKRVVKARRA
ncbi:MAG: peptide chain release factor N(5)-glutamine methyltransferase [Ignavibacteria bacterium]|nr:peptide chain release factor N(5)-glutamine methyltransferase [Ignavibacteria bacterium]MBI3765717.1 peptide chain release factor N(5)-glutamine methyltransferase [Ignavibacteriales bacterium]